MRAAIFAAIDIWKHRQAWKALQEGKMPERELEDDDHQSRPGRPQIA
jgi:hypothetical protein